MRLQASLRGFSLIELLVSVGVIGLLLATGVPAFRSYGSRVALDNAIDGLSQAITEARTLSLSPESDKSVDVEAYGVTFTPLTGGYEVARFSKESVADCPFTSLDTVRSANLPGEIQFVATPLAIVFPIAAQGEPVGCGPLETSIVHGRLTKSNQRVLTVRAVTGQVTVTSRSQQ